MSEPIEDLPNEARFPWLGDIADALGMRDVPALSWPKVLAQIHISEIERGRAVMALVEIEAQLRLLEHAVINATVSRMHIPGHLSQLISRVETIRKTLEQKPGA